MYRPFNVCPTVANHLQHALPLFIIADLCLWGSFVLLGAPLVYVV